MQKRLLFVVIAFASFSIRLFGQDVSNAYKIFSAQADSLMLKENYGAAIIAFNEAIINMGGRARASDRLKLAACFAVRGEVDSAFHQLERVVFIAGLPDDGILLNEKRFDILHNDKRWDLLLKQVEANRRRQAKLNNQN